METHRQLVPDEVIKVEKLIIELNENNLKLISQEVSKLLEIQPSCPLLYEFYIVQFIYMSYFTQNKNVSLYVSFLNLLTNIKNLNFPKLLEVLTMYLYQMNTYESKHFLIEMNKHEMIPKKLSYYIKNIINKPNEEKQDHIIEILRKDDLEELQEISTQNSFNFNQIIDKSSYEKYTFITNQNENVSLLDFCAFLGRSNVLNFCLLMDQKFKTH